MEVVKNFLADIIKDTKSKVDSLEYVPITFRKLVGQVQLINITNEELDDISLLEGHQLYSMANEIDTYEQVDVSSMGLEFYEKRFKIVKYSALEDPTEQET